MVLSVPQGMQTEFGLQPFQNQRTGWSYPISAPSELNTKHQRGSQSHTTITRAYVAQFGFELGVYGCFGAWRFGIGRFLQGV